MEMAAGARRKFEILLVEDNPADARLVSLALKGFEEEHYLRVVTDGQLALDYLRRKDAYQDAPRPDMIFLDWKLPLKDGGEILREIRQNNDLKDLPVIVLSGADPEKMAEEANGAGANLFVEKPVTLDRFSFILQYLLEFLKRKKLLPKYHPPAN